MIRLINIWTLKLEEHDDESSAPPYAIASHRWQSDEVTFTDFKIRSSPKVEAFCDFLRVHNDILHEVLATRLNHLWIDSCCIDQSSLPELSESINLMFSWYNHSHICIAYLFDVCGKAVEESSWFARGWTLQELLAPGFVLFVDNVWRIQGFKRDEGRNIYITEEIEAELGSALHERISKRTGIPIRVLVNIKEIDNVLFSEVLDWMNDRVTTRTEDQAYCLLGLLDVNMPLNYGERHRAMIRLLDALRTKFELRIRWVGDDVDDDDGDNAAHSVESMNGQLHFLEKTIARLDRERQQRPISSLFLHSHKRGSRNRRDASPWDRTDTDATSSKDTDPDERGSEDTRPEKSGPERSEPERRDPEETRPRDTRPKKARPYSAGLRKDSVQPPSRPRKAKVAVEQCSTSPVDSFETIDYSSTREFALRWDEDAQSDIDTSSDAQIADAPFWNPLKFTSDGFEILMRPKRKPVDPKQRPSDLKQGPFDRW